MAKKKPYTKPKSMEEIRAEYRLVIQTDPVRAKELKKKIDYFDYGIE